MAPSIMIDGSPIYLDHNATTPILPEVVEAMLPYLREHFGNPSSGHVYGARARSGVARARDQVAGLLGCDPDEVVFTSGGTEANNLAIRGVVEAVEGRRTRIVTTVIEHPATARLCAWLEKHERSVTRIGVDADGRARVEQARGAIDGDTALVTVMHSNNETGVLQPVAELTELAHANGAVFHTDAAQSVGKVPVRVRELGVDLLSVAGHKLYAPKGVGALYVKRGTPLLPFALGASHERGLRPGTENVPAIVGLGAACEAVGRDLETAAARMRTLRDSLWDRLAAAVPGIALSTAIASFGCRTRSTCASRGLRGPRSSMGLPRWLLPRARRATKEPRARRRSSSRWARPQKTPLDRCGSRLDAARRRTTSRAPSKRWSGPGGSPVKAATRREATS
jgi:cysteine desulfurase